MPLRPACKLGNIVVALSPELGNHAEGYSMLSHSGMEGLMSRRLCQSLWIVCPDLGDDEKQWFNKYWEVNVSLSGRYNG